MTDAQLAHERLRRRDTRPFSTSRTSIGRPVRACHSAMPLRIDVGSLLSTRPRLAETDASTDARALKTRSTRCDGRAAAGSNRYRPSADGVSPFLRDTGLRLATFPATRRSQRTHAPPTASDLPAAERRTLEEPFVEQRRTIDGELSRIGTGPRADAREEAARRNRSWSATAYRFAANVSRHADLTRAQRRCQCSDRMPAAARRDAASNPQPFNTERIAVAYALAARVPRLTSETRTSRELHGRHS